MARLLIDDTSQLMPKLREILRRHGVTRAAFFGSVARGQESENSDVDILVEFAPDTAFSIRQRSNWTSSRSLAVRSKS